MNESVVFAHALKLARLDERAAYLAEACAGDARLRAGVEALLRAHATDPGFLEEPAAAPGETVDAALATGSFGRAEPNGVVLAGRYRLLEPVGEGGMGTVWVSQQTEPVKRLVAVKLIKAGMDSKAVLARFEAERQALALMDHPNIAKVFDAGATEDGRPFFVMELVRGVPITTYCDDHKLTPRQRLELFVPVCHAIQHAHQKGVVHRDIKPNNVLVAEHDDRPVPKVIDFGVAKATGAALTDMTLHTGLGAVVGTPEYMSPEQASFDRVDVDTRSDVYSLGVLLYELLAGSPPFSRTGLARAGLLEVLRVVREQEPPRPSTKLSTADELPSLAARRGVEPRKLCGLVRGDLDWIVMKALEKDRTRRYDTPNGLAADVLRHLADEPVEARSPSGGYRLRKFARRNKRALATAGAVAVAVVLAVGSFGWAVRDREARRVEAAGEQARREAEADRERAAREAGHVRELDLALRDAALYRDRGDWPKAGAAAQRAEWLLAAGGGEAERRRVEAMRADLGMVTRLDGIRLLMLADGREFLKLEYRNHIEDRRRDDPAYTAAFREYGIDVTALDAAEAAGRVRASGIRGHLAAALDEWLWAKIMAEAEVRRLVERHTRALEQPGISAVQRDASGAVLRTAPDALRESDAAYARLRAVADLVAPGEIPRRLRDPAAQKDKQALEELARRPGVVDLPPSTAMLLAHLLHRAGALATSAEVLLGAQRRAPDDLVVNYELAVFLPSMPGRPQRLEEAISFMRAALALRPDNAGLHLDLARLLAEAPGRNDQAVAEYRRGLALRRPGLNPNVDGDSKDLGRLLEFDGLWADAGAHYEQFIAAHPQVRWPRGPAACAYRHAGQWDKAIAAARELVRHAGRKEKTPDLPDESIRLAVESIRLADLARLLATCPDPKLRNPGEALKRAARAVELTPQASRAWEALGVAHYAAGEWEKAVAALDTVDRLPPHVIAAEAAMAASIARGDRGDRLPSSPAPYVGFFQAMAHWQRGDREAARRWYERAVAPAKDAEGPVRTGSARREDEELARHRTAAARLLGIDPDRDRPAEAAPDPEENRRKYAEARSHYDRGVVLLGAKKLDEATAAFRQALALGPDFPEAYWELGRALSEQGEFAEAAAAAKRAHALGPMRPGWPSGTSAQMLASYERMAALDARLPDLLRGKVEFKDDREKSEFAALCARKRMYASSARLYQDVLKAGPEKSGLWMPAGRAMTLAGFGRGDEAGRLDEAERARWRGEALRWLRADLGMLRERVEKQKTPQEWELFRKQLVSRTYLGDLPDPAALAKLPPAEREAWEKVWSEVEALRQKVPKAQP